MEASRTYAEVMCKFDLAHHTNYKSYYEHEALSEDEVGRLIGLDYIEIVLTWTLVLARWSYAVATRLASIVKTKANGSLKLRFVMDLLRSCVNGRSNPPETCAAQNHRLRCVDP